MGLCGGLTLVVALPSLVGAQPGPASRPSSAVNAPQERSAIPATIGTTQISVESSPYHLDWNGASGTLTRHALGNQPEVRMPLVYLHSEPGPKGYAKYLTWFLARDKDRFSLAWCYLNDTGQEFYCWLYQFPNNQLTTLRFVGDYHFVPGAEPVAPAAPVNLAAQFMPSYSGPDFKFRDWTRRSGKLDQLSLQPVRLDMYPSPQTEAGKTEQGTGKSNPRSSTLNSQPSTPTAPAKTLTNLRVYPLHEIHVASGNGWREGGWRELHALAYDSANDPYYLILYSNVNQGYVVDLKHAQTFVTDFGQKVDFVSADGAFTGKEEVVGGPTETRVRRFTRLEIPLTTTQSYDHPYANVDVYMNFRTPDGKRLTLPAYWDGGKTWRVRFAPTQVGRWSWRSSSIEPELTDQTGSFSCIADKSDLKGFITVAAGNARPHTFTYADGLPFLPVFLHDPVYYLPSDAGGVAPPGTPTKSAKPAASASVILPSQDNTTTNLTAAASRLEDDGNGTAANVPASYAAFTRRVDEAAALGFNRFWGGWILDPVMFDQHKQVNEGGAPFTDATLETINPAYFQWMDRRVAYCNEHGIIPDIGLTDLSAPFLSSLDEAQLSRLWRYVLARYASYNVCWNLFGKSADTPFPPDAGANITALVKLTRLYDPYQHPLTTVVSNAKPLPPIVPDRPSGAPVIFTPDRPRPNGNIPMLGGGTPNPVPGTGKAAAGDKPVTPLVPGRTTPEQSNMPPMPMLPTPPLPDAPAGPTNPQTGGGRGTRQGAPFTGPFGQNGTGYPGRMGRGGNRNGNRGGSGTPTGNTGAGSDSDYVVIVDPQLAAGIRSGRNTHRTSRMPAAVPVVRYGNESWLNVITLSGGDIGALLYDYSLSKPMVIQDMNADSSADETRFRLWETVMRGGFWAGSPSANPGAADSLNNPIARWELAWAKLFQQTHYQRLVPHQDMLGGLEESIFERRRRKQAEAEANRPEARPSGSSNTSDMQPTAAPKNPTNAAPPTVPVDKAVPADPSDDTAEPGDEPPVLKIPEPVKPAVPGPIYVLADPGWEYVVYFQRGGSVTLDLLEAIGKLRQVWYNPRTGQVASEDTLSGGSYRAFTPPDSKDWVLYLTRR